MKEELSENVVEVRRLSNRVIPVVVFEEDVLRLICGYALQIGRCLEEHALVAADIDKRKIRKVMRKTCTERRKISLLKV